MFALVLANNADTFGVVAVIVDKLNPQHENCLKDIMTIQV